MSHEVFISYSSRDKHTADAVCAHFETNGIKCWVAPRDIVPGHRWGKAIINAINTSKIMVLIFSSNANTSTHILNEVERAVNKGLVIIPFRIENVEPSQALELYLGSTHWLDALTPTLEEHIKHLVGIIKNMIGKEPSGFHGEEPGRPAASQPPAAQSTEMWSPPAQQASSTSPPPSQPQSLESGEQKPFFMFFMQNKTFIAFGSLCLLVVLVAVVINVGIRDFGGNKQYMAPGKTGTHTASTLPVPPPPDIDKYHQNGNRAVNNGGNQNNNRVGKTGNTTGGNTTGGNKGNEGNQGGGETTVASNPFGTGGETGNERTVRGNTNVNPTHSASEYIALGDDFTSLGDDNSDLVYYESAIENYTEAITQEGRNAEAYDKRGNVYRKTGDYDKAIQDFTKAIDLNPKLADAYNNRGLAYDNKGDCDKAIQDFTKAIDLNPKSADAYNNRGAAYRKKDEYDKAILDFAQAIELNPKYAEAYNNRGLAYGNKGDCDKAIQDFTKAIELKPKYAEAYNNRGNAYDEKGDHDKARQDYAKANELN
jgi:Flp pilus assembly protein TadD